MESPKPADPDKEEYTKLYPQKIQQVLRNDPFGANKDTFHRRAAIAAKLIFEQIEKYRATTEHPFPEMERWITNSGAKAMREILDETDPIYGQQQEKLVQEVVAEMRKGNKDPLQTKAFRKAVSQNISEEKTKGFQKIVEMAEDIYNGFLEGRVAGRLKFMSREEIPTHEELTAQVNHFSELEGVDPGQTLKIFFQITDPKNPNIEETGLIGMCKEIIALAADILKGITQGIKNAIRDDQPNF